MDRIQELEQINSELRARAEKAEEMCGILQKIIEHQNREGAVGRAVAITADGTVYTGSAMPGNRHVATLVGYLFDLSDWIRTVRATRLQKRSGIK